LLPLISTGFTDSHWIREAFGTVAYGFAPVIRGDPDAYLNASHAADEALAVADLVEMAEFHLHAAQVLHD
jgi:acetylornithine deacetylase/succinyl-diaminopimelate desuccinylase-like protein